MIQTLHGVITAINGTSPGPASGISYGVLIQSDEGSYPVGGIVPVIQRWDDQWDVVAIEVGTAVHILDVDGYLQLMQRELPDVGDCGGNSPQGLLEQLSNMTAEQKAEVRKELGL